MIEFIPLIMFAVVCMVLMLGYPVAYSLAGTALAFAAIGLVTGNFEIAFLQAFPNRVFGVMSNMTLIAVPLFVLMGVMLEKSRVAEELLENMSRLLGSLQGGLAIAVVLVGALLAASTGIVGATVVTMGLMSLPIMLQRGYDQALATGTICATGTLGQIIPPSIALVLLGDILSSSYQQAQLSMGIFSPKTVSVGDLFVGAIIPGMLLVVFYILYILLVSHLSPKKAPSAKLASISTLAVCKGLLPPLILIFIVLGSILLGAATPTEAAGVGALGATVLALLKRRLSLKQLKEIVYSTTEITAMIFMILIAAGVFSLVFRGFGGEALINDIFSHLPGGTFGAVLVVMVVIFILGFILDFIEITFVVVPIVAPILLQLGVDPVWLGIMIAINLQTSFLTPPFGFALFYLRGVTPPEVATSAIYKGIIPFIAIQLLLLLLLAFIPELATWLPQRIYQ